MNSKRKILVTITICAFVLILILAIFISIKYVGYKKIKDSIKNSTIEMKVSNVTSVSADVSITNNGSKDYITGEKFRIMKKGLFGWCNIKTKSNEISWDDVGIVIGSARLSINWDQIYGKLTPGSYLLVKEVLEPLKSDSKIEIYAEFEVE